MRRKRLIKIARRKYDRACLKTSQWLELHGSFKGFSTSDAEACGAFRERALFGRGKSPPIRYTMRYTYAVGSIYPAALAKIKLGP